MEAFTGNDGDATFNGTELYITGWSVDNEAEEHDTTNTGGSGYGDLITGTKRLTATVDLNWDASINPMDNPPNLVAGATITTTKLYLDGKSSPYWLLPSAKVTRVNATSRVGSVTTFSVTIRSKGTFTPPTGTFTPASA
jgi:hypothetical protein